MGVACLNGVRELVLEFGTVRKGKRVGDFRIMMVLNLDQWKVIVDNHLPHLTIESVI